MNWWDKFTDGFYFVWGVYVGLLTITITAAATVVAAYVVYAGTLHLFGM